MRKLLIAGVCFGLVFAAVGAKLQAEPDDGPGRIHRIDLKAKHPKAYRPSISDLVKCYFDFPIVPEQIVDDLRVKIDGNSFALVAVVGTSKPGIVGSGQISAFFMPRRTGLSRVTITALIPGQAPRVFTLAFLVGVREKR